MNERRTASSPISLMYLRRGLSSISLAATLTFTVCNSLAETIEGTGSEITPNSILITKWWGDNYSNFAGMRGGIGSLRGQYSTFVPGVGPRFFVDGAIERVDFFGNVDLGGTGSLYFIDSSVRTTEWVSANERLLLLRTEIRAGQYLNAGSDAHLENSTVSLGGAFRVGGTLSSKMSVIDVGSSLSIGVALVADGSNISTARDLAVNRGVGLSGSPLSVGQSLLVGGNFYAVNSPTTVGRQLSIGSNFNVFDTPVSVAQSLSVGGNLNAVNSPFNVGGTFSMGSGLNANNSSVAVGQSLSAASNIDLLNSPVRVGQHLSTRSSIVAVNSPMNVAANLTTGGNFSAQNSPVNVGKSLSVNGQFNALNSPLAVGENMNVGGNVSLINSPLRVGGDLSIGGSLAAINSSINVGRSLGVGGNLELSGGSLTAPIVSISPGGLLSGTGSIFGTLINSGTVSPGNSPGTIYVGGNYIQSSSGTLVIQIPSRQGPHDRLVVGGRASLDGTLALSIGFAPQRHDSFTILTASRGIDGEFSRFINPYPRRPGNLLYFDVSYEENAVLIEAIQNDFKHALSIFKLTPNHTATAAALDSALFDMRQDEVLTYLDALDIRAVPGNLDLIAPDELTSLYTIGFSQSLTQVFTVEQRLADLRLNRPQIGVPSDKPKGARFGHFVTATGAFTDQGSSPNAPGYDVESGGSLVGLDYRVSEGLTIGFATGYSRTSGDITGAGSVTVDGGRAALYGQYYDGDFFAQGMIGGGFNSYDTRRTALEGTALGDTDGTEINAAATFGYDVRLGQFTITPLTSAMFTQIGISSFDERGSLQPLRIENQEEESFRTRAGLRASTTRAVGKASVTPSVSAEWQHEYMEDELGISSRFANGSGESFTVHGPKTNRDSALLTAALNVSWNRVAWYLAYQADIGRNKYENHSALTGIRVSW